MEYLAVVWLRALISQQAEVVQAEAQEVTLKEGHRRACLECQ